MISKYFNPTKTYYRPHGQSYAIMVLMIVSLLFVPNVYSQSFSYQDENRGGSFVSFCATGGHADIDMDRINLRLNQYGYGSLDNDFSQVAGGFNFYFANRIIVNLNCGQMSAANKLSNDNRYLVNCNWFYFNTECGVRILRYGPISISPLFGIDLVQATLGIARNNYQGFDSAMVNPLNGVALGRAGMTIAFGCNFDYDLFPNRIRHGRNSPYITLGYRYLIDSRLSDPWRFGEDDDNDDDNDITKVSDGPKSLPAGTNIFLSIGYKIWLPNKPPKSDKDSKAGSWR